MQPLHLTTVALGALLLLACGTPVSPNRSPKHIRQSTRQLNLASGLYIKGCYVRALEHYQQAHERYTAADQMVGVAHSLNGIANVYYRLGDLPSAVSVYNDAIEAYDLAGAHAGSVRAICNKAATLIAADRLDEAESVLDQADDRAKGDDVLPALRQKARAMLVMQRGNHAEAAEDLLQKAIQAAKEGEPDQLASANYTMGRLLLADRRTTHAVDYLKRSLSLDQTAGAYDDIAHDLSALGRCHLQLEHYPQAVAYLKRSIKIFALLGNAGKVQELAALLKAQSSETGVNLQATLHWVNQWLGGQKEANLCR
jgi:tetratricopeptide (TPR) repeat protein